jgi:hypothetical protein
VDKFNTMFTPCQGGETEAALLSAVHAARLKYEAGSVNDKPHLREIYLAALKAFNAHVCAGE